MRLKELYNIINSVAPFALSQEYCRQFGAHDNSGVQLDCGGEIDRVLFSLDLSKAAVETAIKTGAKCIVTHHPAIFSPLYSLETEGSGANLLACAKAGISVISAHLNLDCAPGGIDESLMHGLGGEEALAVYEQLTGGAYGRVYEVETASLETFVEKAKKTFHTNRVVYYGNAPVKRVASFCGAGFDYGSLGFAIAQGADTIVTSDGKHHLIAEAVEKGLNVLLLTHYSAEHYGFSRFAEKIKKSIGEAAVFTDERFL